MGNAASSAPPPLPLDEDDAFAIATHWQATLRNWVRLTTHDEYGREPVAFRDAQRSGMRHFEWVTFGLADPRFGYDARMEGAAARASTIVWLALAGCAGFSGRENPRFWKRVFSALWDGEERRDIAEHVRFFEDAQRPFPCVRIIARSREGDTTLRALFRSGATDRELRRVLQRLEPHLGDRTWWRRAIPVEIIDDGLYAIRYRRPRVCLPKHTRRPRALPAFRVVTVRMTTDHIVRATSDLGTILSVFGGIDVHVPRCELDAWTPRSAWVMAPHRLHGDQRLHIETLRHFHTTPYGAAFYALCSAIPHAPIVSSLEIRQWRDSFGRDDTDAAWLGYALFHPDSAGSSSLTALSVTVPRMGSSAIETLGRMATGNNLLCAMGATTTVSSAYHEARVTARTRIYADDRVKSRVLYTFSREGTVTLCVASLEEIQENAAWVRVVVPACGLGWMQFKQITSVVSRDLGLSTLRRLELSKRLGRDGHLEPHNRRLLPLLGATLTRLILHDRIETLELQEVLQCCPNLQALRARHDGDCWSHAAALEALPPMPRLQTLELLIYGRFFPLRAPQLNDLTCLRVIDQGLARRPFQLYRTSLLETLRRYPQLSHVYWSSDHCKPCPWWEASGYRPWWTPPAEADLSDWQSTSYTLLGENVRSVLDYTNKCAPLPLAARLAFLSVFSSTAAGAMPRLSPDVVSLVFALSSTRVPRQLLIRQLNNDPSE